MKKIFTILTVLAIVFGLSLTAFAANYDRLDDQAGVLSEREQEEVAAKLDEVSEQLNADIVVVTVTDAQMGGKSDDEFTDEYYDTHLYATDSVILLVNVESGYKYLSTSGKGIDVYNQNAMSALADVINPYLENRNYAGAFTAFADKTTELFQSFDVNGVPVDIDGNGPGPYDPSPYEPGQNGTYEPERTPATFGNVLLTIVIAFVIAFLISLIITAVMKSQMKSVIAAVDADQYVEPNQCHITGSRDRFLYHTVQVIPLQRMDNNRPGGSGMGGGRPGGGSPTHVSHSGVTHGGGRF